MNRRALFIALFVIVAGVVVQFLYQSKFETEVSGGEMIKLIVTTKAIERGTVITEEMLSTKDMPQAYVEDRAVKEVERSKIVGLRVRNTLQEAHTIMWPDLITASDEQPPLGPAIQPGNRAVTVAVSNEESNIALIRPGDRVDVIGIMQLQGTQLEDPYTAVVLLQRVLVLAAGMQTVAEPLQQTRGNDPSNPYVLTATLTLSLTIPETQLLSLSAQKGRITFALRNPDDQRTVDRVPDISTEQMANPTARASLPLRGNPIPQRTASQ